MTLKQRLDTYRDKVLHEMGQTHSVPREIAEMIAKKYPSVIHWGEMYGWDEKEAATKLLNKFNQVRKPSHES